jgi:hypothetical protein
MNRSIRIGFYEPRRKEFRDLVHSLRTSSKTTMMKLSPNSEVSERDIDVILVSDDQRVIKSFDTYPPVVRVTWNGSSEVIENIQKNPEQAMDTYLTFFTDVATELSAHVVTIHVPFVFSRPSLVLAPTQRRIGYVGEVDISGQCFQNYDRFTSSLAIESVRDLSLEIHNGNQTLSEVLNDVPVEFQGTGDLESRWKWSVRNWVRFRFISSLVTAFPKQVELRGNDWVNLGFQAKKSRYHPLYREIAYARNAVSIDFGSKSTTDCVYPRSTEIIMNKGGLLQLNGGTLPPPTMTELSRRRFDSESDMLEMADEKLQLTSKVRRESDEALLEELSIVRVAAVNDLIAIFFEAYRESETS